MTRSVIPGTIHVEGYVPEIYTNLTLEQYLTQSGVAWEVIPTDRHSAIEGELEVHLFNVAHGSPA